MLYLCWMPSRRRVEERGDPAASRRGFVALVYCSPCLNVVHEKAGFQKDVYII